VREDVYNTMAAAGGRDTRNFAANKGINVMGERNARLQQQQHQRVTGIANEDLINRVRERIKARGARGILNLGKSFKIMDDDGSGYLDNAEFSKALKSYRISSDPLEIQAIFETFDPDGNGQIVYNEFLREIMGPMNQRREGLVRKAFKVIDQDGSG
jgi:Ca2+-binding EF-hand superfamily protein